MVEQAPRGCNHHIGAHLQTALLACEAGAVGTPVNGHGAYGQEKAEALHLTVDLLGQFASGRHYQTLHLVTTVGVIGDTVNHRQQVSGGFAGAGLGAGNQVTAFKNYGYGLFLYGSTLLEAHGIESIENIVA